MDPVWSKFPIIPWGSIGWRMGFGEEYWKNWKSWFIQLSEQEKISYIKNWPEPEEWEGFYEFILNRVIPPKFQAEFNKTEQSAVPPSPSETIIEERYRVKWLLTKYMKVGGTALEETEEFYNALSCEESTGEKWLAYLLKPAGVRLVRVKA